MEQGVHVSISGLATMISKTGYVLFQSHKKTEIMLKQFKSSKPNQNMHVNTKVGGGKGMI